MSNGPCLSPSVSLSTASLLSGYERTVDSMVSLYIPSQLSVDCQVCSLLKVLKCVLMLIRGIGIAWICRNFDFELHRLPCKQMNYRNRISSLTTLFSRVAFGAHNKKNIFFDKFIYFCYTTNPIEQGREKFFPL